MTPISPNLAAGPAISLVHINFTRADTWHVRRVKCWGCQQRTRQLATYQEWYGWTITCLGCGDSWQDGERMPRPFMRGWRQKAIADGEKRLKRLRGLKRASERGERIRRQHG